MVSFTQIQMLQKNRCKCKGLKLKGETLNDKKDRKCEHFDKSGNILEIKEPITSFSNRDKHLSLVFDGQT